MRIYLYTSFCCIYLIFLRPQRTALHVIIISGKTYHVNTTAYWIVLLASVLALVIFMVATNYSMGVIPAALFMNVGLCVLPLNFYPISKALQIVRSCFDFNPITRIIVLIVGILPHLWTGHVRNIKCSTIHYGPRYVLFYRKIVFVVQSVNMEIYLYSLSLYSHL